MRTTGKRRCLFVGSLLLALAAACGGKGEERGIAEERPGGAAGESVPGEGRFSRSGASLLLISIDTCRPDRFGCYGGNVDTPRIDAVAAKGARFDRAVAVCPITLPSHASLLTAEFPYRHRIRNNGTYRLAEEKLTLAEWLKDQGYGTAAFPGSFPLDGRFGLDQGFDLYDDRFPPRRVGSNTDVAERTADDVVDRAVGWLREKRDKPFFLFVHFFDPHWPYAPPEPFASAYENPYDGEIAFVDGEVGRLLDELDRLGLADRTLVVLTGDHGESLGEHGEETHSIFTYASTIRVPLLVRWPDRPPFRDAGLRRGAVISSQARQVDIAPTVLDLLGLPPMPGVEGRSLAPLLSDPETPLDLVNYAESFSTREDYGWSEVRSISTDDWKYILLPKEELYDLRADPAERNNLAEREREVAARFRSMLDERIAEDEKRSSETALIEIDAEGRERLEALGYVGGIEEAPSDAPWEDLPDPKDRIDTIREYFLGRSLVGRGRLVEGLEVLRKLAEREPGNPRVRVSLGDARLGLKEYAGAESTYAAAITMLPNDLSARSNLGFALLQQGRADEALEILRAVLEVDPKFESGHARIAEALFLKGEIERATEEYQKELEIYPESPVAYNGLGKIYRTGKRLSEAGKYYLKAVELRPDYAEAYYNLGNLYGETGQLEKAVGYYRKAIEADPNLLEAYYNLALQAKQHGQRSAAADFLRRGIAQNPRFAMGYYGMGNLLREEGMLPQAVEQYRLALRYAPAHTDTYLNLGVAYAALGEMSRAIEAWENAVRAEPNSASARTAAENVRAARAQTGGIR
ncbi:MAG: sulfatase-like hydrolase/transferase [Candidatus Eisenbacteria bacterium]